MINFKSLARLKRAGFIKAVFSIILIGGLIQCATSPTGRSQWIVVSDSEMNQMGLQAFSEMKSKTPIEYNSRINNYVRCVALTVANQANDQTGVRDWEVVVFKDDTANAFALPGGKIGVHTGILKVAKTPDQLAAVLGHEIGHVIARHGAERVSEALTAQGGLMLASVMLDKESSSYNYAMAGLGLGVQFGVLLPFSRKHESEADEIGLYLMSQAGFKPTESVALWKNMAKAGGSSMPEILSTHPSNSSRISQLQSKIPKAQGIYQKAINEGREPVCGTLDY